MLRIIERVREEGEPSRPRPVGKEFDLARRDYTSVGYEGVGFGGGVKRTISISRSRTSLVSNRGARTCAAGGDVVP